MMIASKLCQLSAHNRHGNDSTTYPDLITPACFGEVAYPLNALIIAFLKDFEEPDNQTRCGEHQNFKVDVNRWSSPNLSSGSASKISRCAERTLLSTLNPGNPECKFEQQSFHANQVTYFHITTFSAGTYLALPFATLQSTLVVFNGVGIRKTTFVADNLLPKLAFTATLYDTCDVPISFTVGITRKGSLTFDVERYLHVISGSSL
jgi:hypothetical protein